MLFHCSLGIMICSFKCSLKTLRSSFKSNMTVSILKHVGTLLSRLLILVCSGSMVESTWTNVSVYTNDLKHKFNIKYFYNFLTKQQTYSENTLRIHSNGEIESILQTIVLNHDNELCTNHSCFVSNLKSLTIIFFRSLIHKTHLIW